MKLRIGVAAVIVLISTAHLSTSSAKESYLCYEEAATGFVAQQNDLQASPYQSETWLLVMDSRKAVMSSKRGSYNLDCETSYGDGPPGRIVQCRGSGRVLVFGKGEYKFTFADVGGYVMAANPEGISLAYGKCQKF